MTSECRIVLTAAPSPRWDVSTSSARERLSGGGQDCAGCSPAPVAADQGGCITRVTRAVGTSTLSTLHPHHRHSGDTVAVQLSPPPATGRNCGECSHGGARPLLAPAGSWPPLDAGPGDDSAAVTGPVLVVTGLSLHSALSTRLATAGQQKYDTRILGWCWSCPRKISPNPATFYTHGC